MKKEIIERDTNFELLKIIAMIMIVILHFNTFGIKFNEITLEQGKTFYKVNFMEYLCICAVNLYVMITGYYMVKSNIKIKKVLKMEVQLIAYSTVIYLALSLFNMIKFDKVQFFKLFFPITTKTYWFMSAYLGLYLLIPYINKLINSLTKEENKRMLIILTILLVVLKNIFPTNKVFEAVDGYCLIWFIYLYILAGYIRLYYKNKRNRNTYIIIYFLVVVIQLCLDIMLSKIQGITLIKQIRGYRFSYNAVLVLMESICLFLYFREIKIKNEIANKLIIEISSLTLGVYLLHEHPYFRNILWNKFLNPYVHMATYGIIVALLSDLIMIFATGCIVEKIRKIAEKRILNVKMIEHLTNKIYNIFLHRKEKNEQE